MSPSFASMSDPWRLVVDGAAPGAWNMAVDEVLLDGVVAGATAPTLRFYQWKPPCVSLGYFQSFGAVNRDGCRSLGIDIVRRPTGGRAILHDRELTYSLVLPASVLGHDHGVLPSYYRISLALQEGLRRLGVATTLAPPSGAPSTALQGPVCFDRPSAHEILLDGRKLVGSAQVRRGTALLQHGSILIKPRIAALLACLRLPDDSAAGTGFSGSGADRIEASVAGLAEAGVTDPAQIAAAVAQAFGVYFDVSLTQAPLGGEERAAADALAGSRYRDPGWTEGLLSERATNTTRTR
jgi:lipoyl(octanoyl) transferase